MTPDYRVWTPMTDTVELPTHTRGIPLAGRPTTAPPRPHRPPTVVHTPRARARRWRRILRSPFARDLKASACAAYWPALVAVGLIFGLTLALATRGQYLTVDGWQSIPTGGTK